VDVLYREAFLQDLKKLKKQPAYERIVRVVFELLPAAPDLRSLAGVKSLSGHRGRHRIRIGDYRVGIEVMASTVEVVRVLHRRDFYRYFP